MKIKKMYQGTVPENKILNTYSDSQTDVYACDYINKLNTYSTEEKIVGTYVDGKPKYSKTFLGEYKSGQVLLTNIDNIIRCDGTVTISGVKRLVPYYEYYASKEYCATINVNPANEVVTRYVLGGTAVTSGAFTNLTIEYTKTTD